MYLQVRAHLLPTMKLEEPAIIALDRLCNNTAIRNRAMAPGISVRLIRGYEISWMQVWS